MPTNIKEQILLLFERPLEPVFLPRGDSKTIFKIPQDHCLKKYRALQEQIDLNRSNRFNEVEEVEVINVDCPDLTLPLSLGRRENFSLFLPYHCEMATALIDVFMKPKSLDELRSLAVCIRDRANPFMFNYALSVALLHRPDTKNFLLPSFAEIFPGKYMDSAILSSAKEDASIYFESGYHKPIIIPQNYTASDLNEEHRVAYFREDLGINLHHWHWHLVYPFKGPENIVRKDRRGELFYYMHQQILARYNFERFSNNLARTKRLLNWRDPIPEGYFPKLDSLITNRAWAPRSSNCALSNVDREADRIRFDIHDMERWRDRILQAIHTGSVLTSDGQTLQLDEVSGIDTLGNMVEPSILSVNSSLYGSLHNTGHMAIGYSHDPDHSHLEDLGVMGDPATAMRDPVFYRWHAFIDYIFQEHKNRLPRYTTSQLGFSDVKVVSAEINVKDQPNNLLLTFWQRSDVHLSRGLDFTPRSDVYVRYTHLQHIPFSYKIQVENGGQQRQGTCRIFLAPKFDERGMPFLYRDQKNLFIELDKFTVTLEPKTNTIERKSRDSAVVIPFERTFRNLDAGKPSSDAALQNFCGCGWPEHMLVPKGTSAGMACQLFVMISDYEGDKVDINSGGEACQKTSTSYCGLWDNKYPDRRCMGYPFDRMPRDGVNTLSEFLTPNMTVTDVTIRFLNETIEPKSVGQNQPPSSCEDLKARLDLKRGDSGGVEEK